MYARKPSIASLTIVQASVTSCPSSGSEWSEYEYARRPLRDVTLLIAL